MGFAQSDTAGRARHHFSSKSSPLLDWKTQCLWDCRPDAHSVVGTCILRGRKWQCAFESVVQNLYLALLGLGIKSVAFDE